MNVTVCAICDDTIVQIEKYGMCHRMCIFSS